MKAAKRSEGSPRKISQLHSPQCQRISLYKNHLSSIREASVNVLCHRIDKNKAPWLDHTKTFRTGINVLFCQYMQSCIHACSILYQVSRHYIRQVMKESDLNFVRSRHPSKFALLFSLSTLLRWHTDSKHLPLFFHLAKSNQTKLSLV